jgi:peptidyl-prolyl cis-trans isomerase D
MLAAIRAFAKSWVAAVLIGLLIVSFAVFGITDVFNNRAMGDAVVKAGSRTATSADYKREYDLIRQNLEQQVGQPLTPEVAAENGIDKRVLERLANRLSFTEFLHRIGLRPSDKLIAGEIQKIPAFFDPVSGRFDKRQYATMLAQNQLTPALFETEMRDTVAAQHLEAALGNGVRVPRAYSAMAAVYMLESRDFAYFELPASSVPAPAQPTDQQLTAFMRENAAQLTRPEYRVLTVVRFAPDLASAPPANEADVRKLYDFRKDTLSTPERRTLVQIPARDQATAQQIVARLGRGEEPAAVARSLKVDAITYADKPVTAVADRKVGEAAFRLPAGQVAAVQGDIGMAVVKVVSVTPGKTVTYEEARPQLEAEVRQNAAVEKALALSQTYDEAHQAGANLVEAAQRAGVPTVTLGPVSKQGVGPNGQPVAGLTQKLMDVAFATPAGGDSELIEAAQGEYFAVRVERVIPPALPALAEVRADLARVWMARETSRRLEARANELLARVRKGESLEAVAASAGAQVVRIADVSRQNASQRQNVPPPILGQAFSVKPNEPFLARTSAVGFALGRLEAVRAGAGPMLAQGVELARPQMSQTIAQELMESAQAAARAKVKPKLDYNGARAAIGLPPIEANGKAEKAEKAK